MKHGCKFRWKQSGQRRPFDAKNVARLHRLVREIDGSSGPDSPNCAGWGSSRWRMVRHYPRRTKTAGICHFPREESEQPLCLCGDVIKTQLSVRGWKKSLK